MAEHIMNTSHMGTEQKRRIWDRTIHEVFNFNHIWQCHELYSHSIC